MSVAYASEYSKASSKDAEPPYSPFRDLRDKRKAINDATLNLFDKIMKTQEDKKNV